MPPSPTSMTCDHTPWPQRIGLTWNNPGLGLTELGFHANWGPRAPVRGKPHGCVQAEGRAEVAPKKSSCGTTSGAGGSSWPPVPGYREVLCPPCFCLSP